MTTTHVQGDCLDVLPTLPPRGVQCVVTSPPYYALRDYGLPPSLWPTIEYTPLAGLPPVIIPGCDPSCDHVWGAPIRAPWANSNPGPNGRVKNTEASRSRGVASGEPCELCGGWRGCLGMEPDPLMYAAHLVHVFRILRPALADDGTVWLNLGDSYAAGGGGGGGKFMKMRAHKGWGFRADKHGWRSAPTGTKDKDLLGIPWRVALALQADGWYLRAENIWHKPNCMPESARDRPTRAHEHVFLFAKSERYYYDAAAVAEPQIKGASGSTFTKGKTGVNGQGRQQSEESRALKQGDTLRVYGRETRNRRSVWTIAPAVFRGAHHAVMPEALAEPCILAGSRPGDTVLDPFGGSGTTARVAERLGRNAILIELNPEYIALQEKRLNGVQRAMVDLLCHKRSTGRMEQSDAEYP